MDNPNRALVQARNRDMAIMVIDYDPGFRVHRVRMRVRFSRWIRARVGR